MTYTVELEVLKKKVTIIGPGNLKLLSWDKKSGQATFQADRNSVEPGGGPRVVFRKNGNSWMKLDGAAGHAALPEIVLEEDMNTPPRIFAVDSKTFRRALLLDLNPQFGHKTFGREEAIKWKGSDAHDVKGGLYYPADYVLGRRYPLVIQTHAFDPNRFWIDGPWTTAYAAQPLASKGIMVLQVEDNHAYTSTPEEVDTVVASYEGAVDYLKQKRLIDEAQIGILGFSRTCLYVKYLLTHSKYRFAAAAVTDGVDAGYYQYIATGGPASDIYMQEMELFNGGLPWTSLRSWEARSPGFNVDKIQTPLRIVALNPLSVLGEWEWFAALVRLAKPVDMVVIQDGAHILERPWDRLVSQGGNVDWFRFWLQGYEDPDRAKAEQYRRWEKLCDLPRAKLHSRPAFCVPSNVH